MDKELGAFGVNFSNTVISCNITLRYMKNPIHTKYVVFGYDKMTKHFCWICDKEIFLRGEQQERNFMAGIKIEEICTECEGKLGKFIEQLKQEKQ